MPKIQHKHMWTKWVYDAKMYNGNGGYFRVCELCGRTESRTA